jgi:ATP-binding cassette subfamily C protein
VRFSVALCALIFAGFIETIGIGALLPLLNLVLDVDAGRDTNILNQIINTLFSTIGLEKSFNHLLLVIVITITLKALIIFLALRMVSYIAVDITYDLRRKFINALLSAQWKYYSKLNIGHSANAIATETDHAGQFCFIIGKAVSSAIQAFIYTLIAFIVDWKVSLAAIIMGGVAAFVLKFLIKMTRDAGNDMARILNSILSRLNEALSSAKSIKAMGEETRYAAILERDTQGLQASRKKLTFSSLALNLAHEPIMVLFIAIGLFWAFSFANYPISELFLMAFLFQRLLSQVNQVQNHYQNTAMFEGAVNEIIMKINTANEYQEDDFGQVAPKFAKAIKIQNLNLSYDGNIVFKGFNAQIPAQQMSVIFGPSGSGKSSLLDAILGLTPYEKGKISIDKNSLKEIDIRAWRRSIGYVPQDTFLFHDTISRNVTLGDDSISKERIIEALKKADAWSFVKGLDEGIHHIVGEGGGKLSGGQKQRISVARALVRNPKLLILDEATSSLDKMSEKSILATLKNMLPEITIIAISHDPKILDLADHIIHIGKENS